MSLQSLLIVQFTDNRDTVLRRALRLVVLVLAGSLALAALAALIGPAILVALFGHDYAIAPAVVFVLVASSGLIASLCVSGPALLSLSRHGLYVAGWALASLATILLLLIPLPLDLRVSVALVGGPLLGLALHLTGLRPVRA
jgi:O-antigen/teichoic acid export membrane protein